MAAPTVVVDVYQSPNKLPYSLVTMAIAIHKNRNIDTSTFKWTASGSGTNEYYLEIAAGGNPASELTSGTINVARAMMTDQYASKYLHMEEGTIGSLGLYEYAWGDNDSLGYNTLYVRVGDSGNPDITLSGMSNTNYNQTYVRANANGTIGVSDVYTQADSGERVYYYDAGSAFYVIYYDTVASEWKVGTTTEDPNLSNLANWKDGKFLTITSKETLTSNSKAFYTSDILPDDADSKVTYVQDYLDPERGPASEEINIVWDEALTGDSYDWRYTTVNWWADLTDPDTASALSGYGSGDLSQFCRYITDERDGLTQIDLLGSEPTETEGSPVKNPMLQIALPAGSYKWKCQVINGSKEQATVDVEFTVNAETRTSVTVNSGGGADYTSIAAAITAGEDLIECTSGHIETLTPGHLNVTDDTLIYWNGSGTKPKIVRTNNRRIQIYGEGAGIVGIDTAANTSNSQAGFKFSALSPNCRNNYVAGCHIVAGAAGQFTSGYEFGSGVSFERTARNCAVFNGRTDQPVSAYSVQPENSNFAAQRCGIYGGRFGPSLTESAFRSTGMFTLCVALYCWFEEDSKDTVRHAYGEGFYWYGCAHDGSARMGETGNNFHKARYGRFDSCLFARTASTSGLASLGFQAGTDKYTVVNCVFKDEAGEKGFAGSSNLLDVGVPFPGYHCNNDIAIIHNAFWMTVDSTIALDAGGSLDETHTSGCYAKNNVIALQSSYTAVENTPSNKWTINNNNTIVGNLDSNYQIAGTSTVTTEPGAYYDYNGYVRGTISLAGASIDDPTPSASFGGIDNYIIKKFFKRKR